MPTINNKEAALLGLLCEGPKHPYEIEKEIEDRSMREWTEISMSSVYKTMTRLEQKELAASKIQVSSSNRSQKVYTVTPSGQKILKEWVENQLSAHVIPKWPIDIAISNLALLTESEVFNALRNYIETLEENITGYGNLLDYLKSVNCPQYRYALAMRPLYLMKAEKEWALSYQNEFNSK